MRVIGLRPGNTGFPRTISNSLFRLQRLKMLTTDGRLGEGWVKKVKVQLVLGDAAQRPGAALGQGCR